MSQKKPPKWALNILRLLCKERYLEQIEGDLFELFQRDHSQLRFLWNTLRFLRFRYLKGLDDFQHLTSLAMLNNYFKVAIRTLLRHKSYAAINISGLAIAIACTLLISMYILYERSYDHFYSNADRTYRVANGENGRWTPAMLAYTIDSSFPQVEAATKLNGLSELLIQNENRELLQDGVLFADERFFQVFPTGFLEGDPTYALSEPNHVVLTESVALKLFPDGNALEASIRILDKNYKVTGVVADVPNNTHIPYQLVVANPLNPHTTYHWSGNNTFTYLLLKPDASVSKTSDMLRELYAEKVGPDYIEYTGHETFEALVREYPDRTYAFTLAPVLGLHLENPGLSLGVKGNKQNILVFSLIAFFILTIASINYVNLSTARAAVRAKEVGIRKSIGSHKRSIVIQFLTESTVITCLSVLLAGILAFFLLGLFNHLTDRAFTTADLFTSQNLLVFNALVVLVGPLAGLYPAYFMSRFNPVQALKGGMKSASGSRYLRNGLIAFQFATSVFLIATTLVIYVQVNYLKSRDLGIDISKTLVVENGPKLGEKFRVFKRELEKQPDIKMVSKTSNVPFYFVPNYQYMVAEQASSEFSPDNIFMAPGSEQVFEFKLLAGRFFKRNHAADTSSILINESLAEMMGWDDPINKELAREGEKYRVVGLIKDFNYTSLKRDINPLVIRYGANTYEIGMGHQNYVLVKYIGQNPIQVYEKIASQWEEMEPGYPMQARFLDDAFQQQFASEQRFGLVFTSFSAVAILIACLGLLALTTFVLQKRYKEIAIRKVLGASTPSLLGLMLTDFSKLVGLGGCLGIAAAFYWLNEWLNDYPVRIELSWYLLAVPVILILVLTWAIVSTKSYQAASHNPAVALKEE